MKSETFDDLIKWNAGIHEMLADRMRKGADHNSDERAKSLLIYLAGHEQTLAEEVCKFGNRADDRALNTWVSEHVSEELLPKNGRKIDFDSGDYEQISKEVVDIHNQVMDLYYAMVERAAIPEAKYVMQELYDLHKHEMLRLSDQINNGRSL